MSLIKFVVIGAVDFGKCFQKGTKIKLSNGSVKNVEELEIGDRVTGLDGQDKKIVEIHDGRDRLYEIAQEGGLDYVVNRQHLLCLRFEWVTRFSWKGDSLQLEYIQDMKIQKRVFANLSRLDLLKQAVNFLIKETDRQRSAEVTLSVEDYLRLPGDVRDLLLGYRAEPGRDHRATEEVPVDPHDLGLSLCVLALEGDYSGDVNLHLPDRYLKGDFDARFNLWRGLLEGTATNGVKMPTHSPEMARDIVGLIRSLGMEAESASTEVTVTGFTSTCSKITVREVDPGEFVGFEIEGPDGRFLAPDGTVWHNSTVCGQLLLRSEYVGGREWEKIEQTAQEKGMDKWKYARILDIFEEEMERGKTHEYIAIDFDYGDEKYQLIDTPGHSTFIRSMIEAMTLGAKTACLIISAQDNEFEGGFNRGTLKEHLIIAYTYGVEQLIILCNKMDLVDWSKEAFDSKCRQVIQFVKRLGFKDSQITPIPISAWLGTGLTSREGLPDWYQGESLIEALKRCSTLQKPPPSGLEFTGSKMVIECHFLSGQYVYSKGFRCILHYIGQQNEDNSSTFEVPAELVGIRQATYVKKGTRAQTLWQLDHSVATISNRVLFRVDTSTLGLGKILQTISTN
jgi:signal recognition particle receptor subunit beta